MNKQFTLIKGFSDYAISEDGDVKSIARVIKLSDGRNKTIKERILKQHKDKDGYFVVYLYSNKKISKQLVHRLLAIHFKDNPNNLPCVNHKDGIKQNNSLDNLEWTTVSGNTQHAFDNGLAKAKKGKENISSKQVVMMDLSGNEIKTFGSVREAAREMNLHQSNIQACFTGKQATCGGYKWKIRI